MIGCPRFYADSQLSNSANAVAPALSLPAWGKNRAADCLRRTLSGEHSSRPVGPALRSVCESSHVPPALPRVPTDCDWGDIKEEQEDRGPGRGLRSDASFVRCERKAVWSRAVVYSLGSAPASAPQPRLSGGLERRSTVVRLIV